MVIAYTGEGKGKTTAALGLAFRAMGYKKKVSVVQFIKSKGISGEERFAKKIGVSFAPMGCGFVGIIDDNKNILEHKKAARKALDEARQRVATGCDFLILDEILVAVKLKLISERKLLDFIQENRKKVNIILTGRGASDKLINACDLVTNMQNVKHPFDRGEIAAKAIDY